MVLAKLHEGASMQGEMCLMWSGAEAETQVLERHLSAPSLHGLAALHKTALMHDWLCTYKFFSGGHSPSNGRAPPQTTISMQCSV